MPNKNDSYLNQAFEFWTKNQPLEAGQLIFENLPKESRPRWAIHILHSVIKRTGVKCQPIEHLLGILAHQSAWNKAHNAFSIIRESVLELERLKVRSPEQKLLLSQLYLAENVAKVIYNSTDPLDEFDEDSGWWVLVSLKRILDLLGDEEFSRAMWPALSENII